MMLILKGFIIGLAKIIPGVSGSLVALNLGLYEKCIKIISNFFQNTKKNIMFLLPICIGILAAMIFGSKVIGFFLYNYYFITMVIFIGLLIGSDINFIKNVKTKKEYIYMFITFIIMFSLFFIKTSVKYSYQDNIFNNIYVIFLGFLDATTMIIPAISGTVIFMIIGSYDFILSIFSNITNNIKVSLLFFVGLFIGIILVTRLMNKLLEKKKNVIYSIINGFFLSSMLYLIIETFKYNFSFCELIISLPLFYISYKIGTLSNK